MDTWFTHQPLIKIEEQGLDVIGMVKNLNQRYLVNGKRVSLKELYRLATPIKEKKASSFHSYNNGKWRTS